MGNKLVMLMLLLGLGASAQTLTATCTTDLSHFTNQIVVKEAMVNACMKANENNIAESKRLARLVSEKQQEIDSLMWYKKYYKHSHHVLGKRLIGRIEEMVAHD